MDLDDSSKRPILGRILASGSDSSFSWETVKIPKTGFPILVFVVSACYCLTYAE